MAWLLEPGWNQLAGACFPKKQLKLPNPQSQTMGDELPCMRIDPHMRLSSLFVYTSFHTDMKLVAPLALLAASASAYVLPAAPAAVARRTGTPHALLLPDLPPLDHLPLNLIAEIVDADGERAYGAVDAPGWVAPVGGIAVILTALLPV